MPTHGDHGSVVPDPGVAGRRQRLEGVEGPCPGLESRPEPIDDRELVCEPGSLVQVIAGIGTVHLPCLPLWWMAPHYNQWITRGRPAETEGQSVGSDRNPEEE